MPGALPSSHTQVVVVGSGIGGLAVAVALAQRQIATVVLEQHPRLKPSTAAIVLQPNGLRALETLGVLPAVLERGCALGRIVWRSARGALLLELDYAALSPPHDRAVAILPSDVQEVLLAELAHQPAGEVRWGTAFAGLAEEEGRVAIRAQDGRLQSIVYADVVVGADGAASAVRDELRIAADVTRYKEVHFQMLGASVVGLRDEWRQYLGTGWTVGIAPLSAEHCHVAFTVDRRSADRLRRLSLEAFRAEVARLVPEVAGALSRLSSWQEVLVTLPERVDAVRWVVQHGAVVGDAAHAINPHLVLGANLALADGPALADSVAAAVVAGDFSARRLAPYESARRPQTMALQHEAEREARRTLTANPLVRWLARRRLLAISRAPARRQAQLELLAGLDRPVPTWGDAVRSLVRP